MFSSLQNCDKLNIYILTAFKTHSLMYLVNSHCVSITTLLQKRDANH